MSKSISKNPLVSILMAVYNPNYEWFREQLISLNNQSYDNLELIIYDDCPEKPVDEEFIKNYINKFNYKLIRGKINKGSNKAFEELTLLGAGEYFAYCDQDDIWEKDKIEILFEKIEKDNSVMAYSDMSVIDESGVHRYNTLIGAKPRIKYIYGNDLTSKFFFKNCVSGCCMLIKSEIAKYAVPFSDFIIHDQWLCIVASLFGSISFVDKSLVKYRIHGNNQTGSLRGIVTKIDYYNFRVNTLEGRINELNRIICNQEQMKSKEYNLIRGKQINEIKEFCTARINKDLIGIFKYRYLCEKEAYFEMVIKYMPSFGVKYLLKKLK